MNALVLATSNGDLAIRIGAAVLHFSWQGGLIGLSTWTLLRVLRHRSPQARYAVCLGGMVSMLLAPALTFGSFAGGWMAGGWMGGVWMSGVSPFDGAGLSAGFARTPLPGLFAATPPVLLQTLAALWTVGASLFHFRLLLQWRYVLRLGDRGVSPVGSRWSAACARLADEMGITRRVRVLGSALVSVPSTVGWLRPVILLPLNLAEALTPAEVRAVLAHELAHIRRYDYAVNLAQGIFESLLFFHPATWWLSQRLRDEREYCCDDIAVRQCSSPIDYAQALTVLEEIRQRESDLVLASTGGDLMKRVTRILVGDPTSSGSARILGMAVGACGIALTLTALGVGCSRTEETISAPASGGASAEEALTGSASGDLSLHPEGTKLSGEGNFFVLEDGTVYDIAPEDAVPVGDPEGNEFLFEGAGPGSDAHTVVRLHEIDEATGEIVEHGELILELTEEGAGDMRFGPEGSSPQELKAIHEKLVGSTTKGTRGTEGAQGTAFMEARKIKEALARGELSKEQAHHRFLELRTEPGNVERFDVVDPEAARDKIRKAEQSGVLTREQAEAKLRAFEESHGTDQ